MKTYEEARTTTINSETEELQNVVKQYQSQSETLQNAY